MSTLVLPVDQSLNGAVVTCYAGPLTSDPLAGNLTIQVIKKIAISINLLNFFLTGPPSTPTVDSMEYSVVDSTTGRIKLF